MTVRLFFQKHALNAVTAVLFALAFWRLGPSPELPAVLVFIFGGVLLSVIDWKVQRLPTQLVYYTLIGVGGGLVLASLLEWDWVPLATAVAGGTLFAGTFYLIWYAGQFLAWQSSASATFGWRASSGYCSDGTDWSSCCTARSPAICWPCCSPAH